MTSALRPHDVTNAFLSMYDRSAKVAVEELTIQEHDEQLFDQRTSHAVVRVADERTSVDIMVGLSGLVMSVLLVFLSRLRAMQFSSVALGRAEAVSRSQSGRVHHHRKEHPAVRHRGTSTTIRATSRAWERENTNAGLQPLRLLQLSCHPDEVQKLMADERVMKCELEAEEEEDPWREFGMEDDGVEDTGVFSGTQVRLGRWATAHTNGGNGGRALS